MKKRNRRQWTAELIPLVIYKSNTRIGDGWVLVREDGTESKPILYDSNSVLLPAGTYTILPQMEISYLVVVPERTQ